MNDDRTFERNARAWLELGPTDLPDRVVVDTLRTIELTPQQRVLPGPWKDFRMTIPMRLATAAVIGVLAVGSGYLLLRSLPTDFAGPRPTESSSPPPAASAAVLDYSGIAGWIVFSRGSGIWLVKADGTGLHELAPTFGDKTSFDISPDGRTIVFASGTVPGTEECFGRSVPPCPGSRLWEAPIDGASDPIAVPTGCAVSTDPATETCRESDPDYSPDGTRIAFARTDGRLTEGTITSVIGVYDRSGGVQFIESTRSTDPEGIEHRGNPTWSPDGSQIAYRQYTRYFIQSRIEVVNVDGTGLHELPVRDTTDNAGPPSWSADNLIAFSTSFDVSGLPIRSTLDLFTVRPDGTALTPLCDEGGCLGAVFPTWTPDSQHILYWRWGTWGLMDPDGGNAAPINATVLTLPDMPVIGSFARLQPTP